MHRETPEFSMNLTEQQKRHLKALAHPRKPIVIVGNAGFSDAVAAELEQALDDHELLKVRLRVGDRDARDAVVGSIVERTGAVPVQRIGNVLTLFRRNPDRPKVQLP